MFIFISYAHADQAFADRLDNSLTASKEPEDVIWIDRRRLEGGVRFTQEIDAAVDHCTHMIVILSPDAITSEWVLGEVTAAKKLKKRIISVLYRPYAGAFTLLDGIQYIDFMRADYERAFNQLRYVLVTPPSPTEPTARQSATPVPLTPQELRALYQEGNAAVENGDFERALASFQRAADAEPGYLGGGLAQRIAPR